MQASIRVFFGNRDNESQVSFHHLFFRSSRSSFAHAHATIDLFNFHGFEADFVLNYTNALLQSDNIFAVVGKALCDVCFLRRTIDPVELALRTLKTLDKVFAVHAALSHHKSRNFTLRLTQYRQYSARRLDQGIEHARCQLEELEQLSKFCHLFLRFFAVIAFFGERLFSFSALTLKRSESFFSFNGIRAGVDLF